MLALGNVLNAGSARAGAKGFRLEVLLKLAETKVRVRVTVRVTVTVRP